MSKNALLLPVFVPTFLLAFGQGMLIPTLPIYAQSFGFSFTLISIVVAGAGIGMLLADVPSGMMLERLGRKPAMIIGTTSLAISTLALAFATAFPEMLVLRLVSGIGSSLWGISRLAYLTDVVPISQRGRALASFGGITRIGTFGGPGIGGLLGYQFGLQAPIIATAGMALIATLISLRYISESRHAGAPKQSRARWAVIGKLAKSHYRELATAGSAQIFAQAIRSGRQIIVPLYGASVLGLDIAAIGTIVSISAAIDMSLFIPAGFIMDRLGRKYASVPSFAVMAIGMAMIPFAGDFVGLLAATAVLGLGNGLGSGAMMTLGADLAPKEATGEFLGLWRLVGDSGTAGGPVIVGTIADVLGLQFAAFVLAGIGIFAAGTLWFFVKETLAVPEPPPAKQKT